MSRPVRRYSCDQASVHSGSIKSSAMMAAQTHQPPHVCCPPRQMSPLTVWPPLDTVVSYGDNVITCPGWTWLVTLHPHHQHQHCSSRYVDILSVAGGHRSAPHRALRRFALIIRSKYLRTRIICTEEMALVTTVRLCIMCVSRCILFVETLSQLSQS